MQVVIRTRNLDINERLKTYVETKVGKLDRYLPNIEEARIDLATQQTKSIGDRQIAQLTLRMNNGSYLRAEERSSDLQGSIDTMLDKMTRQIERYKGKHWRSQNRAQDTQGAAAEPQPDEAEESAGQVVRVKRFRTRPMDVEEAIEQMEMLGHDFFAFFDVSENAFSVVYRRRDGGYGLLQPEVA
jgi:putative sigma-54 modulation protein